MIVSSNGGGDFKPVPEGTYVALCVRVIDLGTQVTTFKGAEKNQRKVLIAWEVPEVPVEFDGETAPALLMSSYTASLHEKAALRKHLEAWRGKRFTDDELAGFDLKNVIGKPCQVQVLHSEDGNYANVAAIMAVPKGLPIADPYHPLVSFDLEPGKFSPVIYEGLSDKLKAKIAQSPEYKAATGGPAYVAPGTGAHDLDDEIPF